MLEALKNHNVAEMLFVIKEESGINNFKKVSFEHFFPE